MKRGRLIVTFLVLFSLLFIINLVSAISTPITVTTLPNHDIMVGILKPGETYYLLDSFHGKTDSYGEFSLTYISSLDVIDIGVWVKKDNQVIVRQTFKNYYTGSPVSLEVFPEGYINENKPAQQNETNLTSETNITIVNTTSNQTISNENQGVNVSPGITGLSTSEGVKGFFSKNITYLAIALGVIILLFLGFMFFKKRIKPDLDKNIKVKKLSEVKKERDYKKIIGDAEKKIDEAQKEIKGLKNYEKIEEINRRMIEDQKELKRLRGEG